MIPFYECGQSTVCAGGCDLRLRSDVAFFAARFAQSYGGKITDAKSLCAYARALDGWLDEQTPQSDPERRRRLHNCTKIRLIRRMMQQREIPQSPAAYQKLLQSALAEGAAPQPEA